MKVLLILFLFALSSVVAVDVVVVNPEDYANGNGYDYNGDYNYGEVDYTPTKASDVDQELNVQFSSNNLVPLDDTEDDFDALNAESDNLAHSGDEPTTLDAMRIDDNTFNNMGIEMDDGWSARRQTKVKPSVCTGVLCYENQKCTDYEGHPHCVDGSYYHQPDPRDGCPPNSCLNNGTCINNKCYCQDGHRGNNCESTKNACNSKVSPCKGKLSFCIGVAGNGYRCVSPCDLNPCPPKHNCIPSDENDCDEGTCSKYICLQIDPCASNPCEQFQICEQAASINSVPQYKCSCMEGYMGSPCVLDPCFSSPCKNGGTCYSEGIDYECNCRDGFRGRNCDPDENPCSSNPCSGFDCRCYPSCRHEHGYYCSNHEGYVGKNCNASPPTLRCGVMEIDVEIPQEFAREFTDDVSKASIYVSSSENPSSSRNDCRAITSETSNNLELKIPLTFGRCGSSLRMSPEGDGVFYGNTVWLQSGGRNYDYINPILDFACSYDLNYAVVTSLKPVVDKTLTKVSGFHEGNVSVGLCKVSTCVRNCPDKLKVADKALYTVAERIHLNIEVTELFMKENLLTDVHEAYLSCSDTTISSEDVNLLRGCQSNEILDVTLGQMQGRSSLCMSFKVPRMPRCAEVYIHILIRLCERNPTEVVTCQSSSTKSFTCYRRLQKRTVTDGHQVLGPIVIVSGRGGVGVMEMPSDEGHPRVVIGSGNKTSIISARQPNVPKSQPLPLNIDTTIIVLGLCIFALLSISSVSIYLMLTRKKQNAKAITKL